MKTVRRPKRRKKKKKKKKMGRLGCRVDGDLNDSKFSEPLPWIGIYIALASLACFVAMAADTIRGIRYCKLWFPCKYFSLNSASLTLIAVAIKLSVDLNTSMPRREDQLAKLSSSVFMCTVMANSMPSLGAMGNQELAMNIMALGILVVTLVVNICIQIGTGVIYVFCIEHAVVMFLMLVLLLILGFSALTVPTTKRYLELKYKKKYEFALKECWKELSKSRVEQLREDLTKFWMMAHTCSPQFVIGRSVTCAASGALCLISACILAEVLFKSYFMDRSFKFCSGESDYKWSTTIVLVVQCVGVGIGTIAPAFRWFTAINFRCPKRGKGSYKQEFALEKYWVQSLIELKECAVNLRIENRKCRKLVHDLKSKTLELCIRIQAAIVLMSKLIRIISIFFVSNILLFCDRFLFLRNNISFRNSISSTEIGSERQSSLSFDLGRFVLHLEGEEALVHLMIKNNCDATDQWMKMGKSRLPKHLMKLLEVSNSSGGFINGVGQFDSDKVPSLSSEEPPNCWSLPLATLTAIAIALPNSSSSSIKKLIHGVNEGLEYVKLIEDHLDSNLGSTNIRKAADSVWLEVELYHKWLGLDLSKLSLTAQTSMEVLQQLSEAAKTKYTELKNYHMNTCIKAIPSNWPVKVLSANSMYRISQTLLLKSDKNVYDSVVLMISEILGACLTNLQTLMAAKCLSSVIEERENSVRDAVYILGKTEKILKILSQRELPSIDHDQMACIEAWRMVYKVKNSMEGDVDGSYGKDFCLIVD